MNCNHEDAIDFEAPGFCPDEGRVTICQFYGCRCSPNYTGICTECTANEDGYPNIIYDPTLDPRAYAAIASGQVVIRDA